MSRYQIGPKGPTCWADPNNTAKAFKTELPLGGTTTHRKISQEKQPEPDWANCLVHSASYLTHGNSGKS
jgi:hypothetical protein